MNTEVSVVDVFRQGGIIAYPTEAVFGLGCDPDNELAIENLLALKNRSKDNELKSQFTKVGKKISLMRMTSFF